MRDEYLTSTQKTCFETIEKSLHDLKNSIAATIDEYTSKITSLTMSVQQLEMQVVALKEELGGKDKAATRCKLCDIEIADEDGQELCEICENKEKYKDISNDVKCPQCFVPMSMHVTLDATGGGGGEIDVNPDDLEDESGSIDMRDLTIEVEEVTLHCASCREDVSTTRYSLPDKYKRLLDSFEDRATELVRKDTCY